MMMSGGNNNNNRFPFTATQWQELEHQALIYKYMISGLPIPPDLLFDVKRSLESSLSSKLMLHQPQHGWNCFQMGFGRKIDPEPGRCRRTDGKKWRCSKEAYPDSKYCERHMHRGRNRSRKPVEIITTPTPSSSSSTTKPPPNILSSSTSSSSSTITKNTTTISNSFLVSPSNTPSSLSSMNTFDTPSYNTHLNHYSFLHPHSSSSRPPGIDFSSQDRDIRDYRYGYGMKGEIDEHGFYSGSSALAHLRQRSSTSDIQSGYPFLQLHGLDDSSKQHKQDYQYFQILDDSDEMQQMQHVDHRENEYDKPQKIMHHFFDELPKNRDSWLHSQDDKSSSYLAASTTQLSISTPHFSHDFFIDHNLNDK